MTSSAPTTETARRFLAECATFIESRLRELVPNETTAPSVVHQAMRWSLFAGGKRIRPALVIATGEAFGVARDRLARTACAFEMIHTYSLIHDDLPSMDDDDLRRGVPTCHKRFGEATAILAGDALQALAFETIANDQTLPPQACVQIIAELARAAGTPHGMVAGQTLDIEAETRNITGAELEAIHRRKTGALLTAAARCGAIIAETNAATLDRVTRYANGLGLLFQITDDLLDVTATAAEIGKTPGKDAHSGKATYPALYGMNEARRLAENAYHEACAALDGDDERTVTLRALARLVLERRG